MVTTTAAGFDVSSVNASHRPSFLDISSMWALGANARTIPPRRRNVPVVKWSSEAVASTVASWNAVQHGGEGACSRTLFVYPSSWGITSQLRDYGDAALISLAFSRPLRHIDDPMLQPKWCAENTWLGCFFEGFDAARCQTQASNARTFLPNVSAPALRLKTFKELSGPHSLIAEKYVSEFSFVLDDPLFFPTRIWEDLLDRRLVRIIDPKTGLFLDPGTLKKHSPSLYQTLAVSTLRTILVPAVFPPRAHVKRAAANKLGLTRVPNARNPCVTLHLRWTDKHADGGVASSLRPTADFVVPALNRVKQITQQSHSCLLLLADDDKHALPVLERELKDRPIRVIVLTRMDDFFERAEEYERYARMGHSYLLNDVQRNSPEKAYSYFREAVVDIVCAAASSNALVGVGSSGVSQLVAQYMGHAHRMDANAMALWQEDFLGVVWRP